jgi:outer membrane immunogenic protein
MGIFMKKLALAVSVLSISAASALAADLPVKYKAPPPAYAGYDWSGWYVGVNGGGGWSYKNWNLDAIGVAPVGFPEGSVKATGGVVGGQFGYRFVTGPWVFGFEGLGDWSNLKGTRVSTALGNVTNEAKIDALGLLVGTFGYTWNNVLLYTNNGLGITSDKYRGLATNTGVAFDQGKEWRIGYAAGVGLEYGFAPNWSAAIEYDHMFMFDSAVGLTAISTGASSRTDMIHQDVDLVTVRVNYRFGGPVVAKY